MGANMSSETVVDTGTNELLCVIRDRVAIITLNRPEVRNAMSDNLTPALRTMIRNCGENPQVGALLLTGAGTAFCAGGNVKGMGAHRDKKKLEMSYDEKVADLQERQRLLTGALASVRKPTIAVINGAATAGGFELALACDLRVASTTAFFALPEAKRSMGAHFASVLLPQILCGYEDITKRNVTWEQISQQTDIVLAFGDDLEQLRRVALGGDGRGHAAQRGLLGQQPPQLLLGGVAL